MSLTRRTMFAIAMAAPALPQAAGEDELKTAREALARADEAMGKVNLPMAVEPAFQFRA